VTGIPLLIQPQYLVTPDGIAVISISGTLVKKASWLDAVSLEQLTIFQGPAQASLLPNRGAGIAIGTGCRNF
jgi:hypothetical protein